VRGFWPYAERAQVASMRHPPLDRRIIEWKERLEALNGFRPFEKRGFDTAEELAINEGNLSVRDLIRIRDTYGATHYLILGKREDLAAHLLYTTDFPAAFNPRVYSVYDIAALTADEGAHP
jgi:hypothetical protein